MPKRAQIRNKKGSGVGSTLDIVKYGTDEYVGRLIYVSYDDGPPWQGWQFDDNSRAEELGWDIFDNALKWAREEYPAG